ncbi:hypothetical protein E3P99_01148 [Wallemia hederae]|uniref:Mitochondrial import inner membrane translocase subunit TIM21 n=1 Tax=Wallemia hederae TaxID=1540922 RepID=A0A4T0FWB7_9BASI|nr:hypothetical protein E3P99_01148 [Wallemia hederae]
MDWSNLQPPLSVTPTTRRRGVALSRSKANFAALVVWYLLSFTEVYKEGMTWLRSGRTEWIAGLITLIPFLLFFNFLQALSVLLDKPASTEHPQRLSEDQKRVLTPQNKHKKNVISGDIPLTPGYVSSVHSTPSKVLNSSVINRSPTTAATATSTPQQIYAQRYQSKVTPLYKYSYKSSDYTSLPLNTAASLMAPSLYGYGENHDQPPTESHTLIFIALFGVSTLIHIIQSIHTKKWWLLATLPICGALELVGWGARYGSTQDPGNVNDYTMQLATLIIAPCFFTAMTYTQLGLIIREQGPKFSSLRPKAFGIIFICNDIISIGIQAVGGAMASFALHSDDPEADPEQGGHVMLGGIIYQFVCLVVYCGFMLEYLARKYENWPCKRRWNNGTAIMRDHDREITKRRLQIVMLALTSALLMVRSSYRVAELADGFAGKLIQTEWALDALDGGMIAALTATMLANLGIRNTVQLQKGFKVNTVLHATRQFASKANDKGSPSSSPNSVTSSQDVDSASTRLQARQLLDKLEASRSRGSTAGPFGSATVSDDMDTAPEQTFSEQRTIRGKVGRATKQTSRFTVIVIGATVTGLLVYTMGTELFSPNSPTRIYNRATKLVSQSEDITRLMGNSKLSFTQGGDGRRRNHQISHATAFDAYGKEHMIMRFGVHSRVSNLNEDQISWGEWIESLTVTDVLNRAKRGVQMLINPELRFEPAENTINDKDTRSNWFGALGSGINKLGRRRSIDTSKHYDEGVVYADLVKENGSFDWNIVYVDLKKSGQFGTTRRGRLSAASAASPAPEASAASAASQQSEQNQESASISGDTTPANTSGNAEAAAAATNVPEISQTQLNHLNDQLEHYKVLLETEKAASLRQNIDTEQSLSEQQNKINELETQLRSSQQIQSEITKERDLSREQIIKLKLTQNNSTSESPQTLEKIKQLEQLNAQSTEEKNDLIKFVDRLSSDIDRLNEEVDSMRTRLSQSREENSTLNKELHNLKSVETTNKYKIQSLEQDNQLLNKNQEWLNSELTNKADEFSTYRREKHAELTASQAQVDTLQSQLNSQSTQLSALQSTYNTQATKLSEVLARSAQLEASLATTHEEYKAEINTQKRVVELLEAREGESRKRVEEVNKEFDLLVAKSESETLAHNEEVARERHRNVELETELNDLRAHGFNTGLNASTSTPIPGTPQAGHIETSFALSPTASIASKFHKGGKSFTEIYSDYAKLENEFNRERAERRRLESCLADVVSEIEERAPILQEQRKEYERRNTEANSLATQLAESMEERDALKATEMEARLVAENAQRESELQSQSIVDLSRQVTYLTRQIAAIEDPSLPTDAEHVAPAPSHSLAVDQAISDRLVLFASTEQLVQQNQNLLKVSRELGHKLEQADAAHEAKAKESENESLQEAYDLIQQLKDEIESSREKAGSYVRERDMFRRLLAQSGRHVPEIGQEGSLSSSENLSQSQNTPDYAALMADLQANFDAYRTEMSADTKSLRDAVAAGQRENSSLKVQLAQAHAQTKFLNERHDMTIENHNMSKMEISHLSTNNQKLQSSLIHEQINLNRVQEELISLKGTLDRTVNENSQLRTEKEVHKGIESRLLADNESLSRDRVHLNDLMRNLQSMQSELERSSRESRSRYDTQIANLEDNIKTLKEDLAHESDQHKQLTLRREIESKEYQNRIDRLTNELHTTKENVVEHRTTRDHLEVRVNDLTQQLKSKEERLAVFENRSGDAGSDLSTEQQLQIEIAELKSELETTKAQVSKSNTHIEQFKEIAQANESALQEMNESYDNYKQSQDKLLADKEAALRQLENRVEGLTAQVEQVQSENDELHQKLTTERSEYAHEKKMLEDLLADLNNAQGENESRFSKLRDDRDRQTTIANENHDKYQREVILHAQTVNQLQDTKKEIAQHITQAKEAQEGKATAEQALKQGELSWESQKSLLNVELTELRKRYDEIVGQNDVLHKHLESVNKKVSEASSAAASAGESQTAAGGEGDENSGDLQSVINYLRNEREYLDLQLSLAKQENSRFKTQLERVNESLDETRALLTEERNKNARGDVSAVQHQELLSKIDQLNLLRESNSTLRFESHRNRNKVLELEASLQAAQNMIQPLEENIRNLQAELTVSKKEVEHWKEDAERWQKRNQQILSKYERIDPAELQKYKDDAEKLSTSLEETKKELELTQAKVHEIEEEKKSVEAKRSELIQRTNEITKKQMAKETRMNEQINNLSNEVSGANEKIASFDKITEELNKLKVEYETIDNSRKELEKKLEESDKNAGDAAMNVDDSADKATLEKELNDVRTKATENETLVEDLKKQVASKEEEIAKARAESNEAANAAATAATAATDASAAADSAAPAENVESTTETTTIQAENADSAAIAASANEVKQLKQKLAAAESEVATLKAKVMQLEVVVKQKDGIISKLEKSGKLKDRSLNGMREQLETVKSQQGGGTPAAAPAPSTGPKATTPAPQQKQQKKQPQQTEKQADGANGSVANQPAAQTQTPQPAQAAPATQPQQPAEQAQSSQQAQQTQPAQTTNAPDTAPSASSPAPATAPASAATPEQPQQQAESENTGDQNVQDKGKQPESGESPDKPKSPAGQISIAGAAGKKAPVKKLERHTPGDASTKVGMGGLISKMLQPQGGSGTTPQKRQRDDETPEKSIKGGAKKSKENKE